MPAKAGSPRKRAARRPASQRRRQIIDVARSIFAQRGYAATSVSDLAAAAGIGEPTIYRYFESKLDLYLAVLEDNAAEIKENWQRIAQEESDALDAIMSLGRWYIDQLSERPEPLLLKFRSFGETHDPRIAELVRRNYLDLAQIVHGLVEKAIAQESLRPDLDPWALSWSFMAFGALLDVRHVLGIHDRITPELLREMTRLMLRLPQ
jgi:AcrR family transcriptional regulator